MSDVTGVECQICHQEAFQLLPRQASVSPKTTITIQCCPRCARRVDAEMREQTDDEMLRAMDGPHRKLLLKERSREWAQSWHGKHVTVSYPIIGNQLQGGRPDYMYEGKSLRTHRINGMAYFGCRNEDIGWGRVRVVIDESELGRIEWWPYYKDTGHSSPSNEKEREVPIVDGYRWGLGTKLIFRGYDQVYDQPFAFYVNWGDRGWLVLEEFDEEAERRAAQLEQERLDREAEAEARKHMGEGI